MIDPSIELLLKEADADLLMAEEELDRPTEDVVSIAICGSTKHSIRQLLTSFLSYIHKMQNKKGSIQRKIAQLNTLRISQLLDQCGEVDERFAKLDISALDCCRVHPNATFTGYCLSVERVKNCTRLARDIEELINTAIAGYEKPKRLLRNKK